MIAAKAEETPWTGLVVEFDGKEVYINAGSGTGLKVGDKFVVKRIVKRLTDPQTGQILSVRKKELGLVQITSVESKLSSGPFMSVGMEPPVRGDLIIPVAK